MACDRSTNRGHSHILSQPCDRRNLIPESCRIKIRCQVQTVQHDYKLTSREENFKRIRKKKNVFSALNFAVLPDNNLHVHDYFSLLPCWFTFYRNNTLTINVHFSNIYYHTSFTETSKRVTLNLHVHTFAISFLITVIN